MTDHKSKTQPSGSDAAKITGETKRQDKALDDALEDTFPASDPISIEQPAPRHKPEEDKAAVKIP